MAADTVGKNCSGMKRMAGGSAVLEIFILRIAMRTKS